MTTPFNVRLPDDACKVMSGDQLIGYVWKGTASVRAIDNSVADYATQHDRWGSMTIDGIVISRNSRTYREAVRTLRAGIQRRVNKDPRVSRSRGAK